MDIGSLPEICARRYPKRPATIDKRKTRTFAEFNERVNALVDSLKKRGLKKADKVGVLSRNNSEVIEIMFACAKGGFIYVPVNFRLAPPELRFVINDAQIQILFVGDDFVDGLEQVEQEISCKAVFRLSTEYEGFVESGEPIETTPASRAVGSFCHSLY